MIAASTPLSLLRIVAALTVGILLTGCATSKISEAPNAVGASHPVRAIAMAPEGGLLAESIAIELANQGYNVIDASQTSGLLVRMNLDEIEVATPVGLQKLSEKGIDAYLTVRSAGGYDGQLASASARASSTHTGRLIAGVSWQNGWGGQHGSLADRTMRKGVSEAAADIAGALGKSLPQEY